MSKKQWVVYSTEELDLNYFDNYEEALKEYESLKENLMSEGHEPNTQIHLMESVKVAVSVTDNERMKESLPKDEGHDYDIWAEWEETDFPVKSD